MSSVGTILVVEDEAYWREDVFREALEDEGFDVFAAATLDRAIGLVDRHSFDVAIVDINLTGVARNVDGVQAMKHIVNKNPNTKIIVVSGSKTRSQKIVQEFDIVAFIEKDHFEISEFVQVIHSAVRTIED